MTHTLISNQASSPWQRILLILFIAQVCTSIGFSSIFPFLPLYVKSLGAVSSLSIEFLSGMVFSAQAFAMMLAAPIWGAIADRHGRKLMVERASFGGALLLLLMAFARSAEELVILRMVQGLITGTIAASNALLAASAPRERIGYAMGLMQVGMGAGIALGPLIGGAIADAFSYRAAFYSTAALLLFAGVLVWVGVQEHFTPPQPQGGNRLGFFAGWKRLLSVPGVAATYSLRFLTQLGRMMIIPIAPIFIESLLTDASKLNTFTGLVVGASSATTTLSAVYLGRLGDRSGHRRIVIASAFIAAILYLFQSWVTAGWQLLLFQALVGVAMGGIIPSISALLAALTHKGDSGAVYGLDNSVEAAGRTVAPLLGSAVAVWFSLRATFTATAVILLVMGSVAAFLLPRAGSNLKKG